MKKVSRKKIEELLKRLDRMEKSVHSRGTQLAIEDVISVFNVKYDEFPIMKRLITNPNYAPPRYGANLNFDTYFKYRWMK